MQFLDLQQGNFAFKASFLTLVLCLQIINGLNIYFDGNKHISIYYIAKSGIAG